MNGRIGALAIVAAASLGTLISSPVYAGDQNGPVVITGHNEDLVVRRVSYADLNLTQQHGQKTLYRRVSYAVGDVCEEAVGPGGTRFESVGCSHRAWKGATPQINRAIERAQEMALYGKSDIKMAAITINIGE